MSRKMIFIPCVNCYLVSKIIGCKIERAVGEADDHYQVWGVTFVIILSELISRVVFCACKLIVFLNKIML